jgi:hypothetical protein
MSVKKKGCKSKEKAKKRNYGKPILVAIAALEIPERGANHLGDKYKPSFVHHHLYNRGLKSKDCAMLVRHCIHAKIEPIVKTENSNIARLLLISVTWIVPH